MKGGKQPGAGRPKGAKSSKTIDKEIALEQMRQMILQEMKPILRGALDSARGLTVMFQKRKVKNKATGKYERTGELVRVTSLERVEELLKGNCSGDDWYYITTKDPNMVAIKELWDRTYGRTKENLDITSGGKPIPILNLTQLCQKESTKEQNRQGETSAKP